MARQRISVSGGGRASAIAGVGLVVAAAITAGCARTGPDASEALDVVATIGEVGTDPGQFVYPRALASDGTCLWVIDKTARIQQIDPRSGDCLALWQMPEWAAGKPTGVTIAPGADGQSLVYVPDTHYYRVMIFRPPEGPSQTAALVRSFGGYGHEPGQFIYPTDIAVLTDAGGRAERLYVSEYGGNDRVQVFDADGAFLFAFGSNGASAATDRIEFNRPQSLEIDRERREIVVSDACNHRIGRFTLDGELIGWLGGAPGTGPGEFRYPYGIHLMGDGTVLVSEFANERVQRVELETGRCLGVYGRPGTGPTDLASPWAVTILGDRAYVLDSGHDRILAFPAPRKRVG